MPGEAAGAPEELPEEPDEALLEPELPDELFVELLELDPPVFALLLELVALVELVPALVELLLVPPPQAASRASRAIVWQRQSVFPNADI